MSEEIKTERLKDLERWIKEDPHKFPASRDLLILVCSELARREAPERDMWWLWDDPEQQLDDPDEYLAECAAEGELVRFQTAVSTPDQWGFRKDGAFHYFNSKAEAERALAHEEEKQP